MGGGGGVFVDKDCLSESCGIKFTLYFFYQWTRSSIEKNLTITPNH